MASSWTRVVTGRDRAAVQRANDRALEYVTLLLRVGALMLGALAVVSVFAWIWAGGWRWGATLGASVAIGAVAGWLGFWHFGNKEWFGGDDE